MMKKKVVQQKKEYVSFKQILEPQIFLCNQVVIETDSCL